MYQQQNGQPDPGFALSTLIVNSAANGPIEDFVCAQASHNGWNNPYFQTMLQTATDFWNYELACNKPATMQTFDDSMYAVYMAACGVASQRQPELSRTLTQQAYDIYCQWANTAAMIEQELNNYAAQQQQMQSPRDLYRGNTVPQYQRAPVQPQQSSWDSARSVTGNGVNAGWNTAPVNNGWNTAPAQPAYVQPRQQAPVTPVRPNTGMFAARQQQPRQQAPAQRGAGGGMTRRYSGQKLDRQQPAQQQQAPQNKPGFQAPNNITPASDDQGYQFSNVGTTPKTGWRPRGKTTGQQPFNPANNPPLGREVAEQHEAATQASGSWESSDFDWDDPSVTFNEEFGKSNIEPSRTKTPQFMERVSSNKDVPALKYGYDTEAGFVEFQFSDWQNGPQDPDFPWELGYVPGTHTRRIAYDVRRKCFIQVLEENTVKYDDHAMMEKSATVRKNAATIAREEQGLGRDFNSINPSNVQTLAGLVTQKQSIIDQRLANAKTGWDKQEEKAAEEAKQTGTVYVAPEHKPSREDALATPLDSETDTDRNVADGYLTEDQIVFIDKRTGYLNEEHAQYGTGAELIENGIDFVDVPAVVTTYAELTPYVLSDAQEDITEYLLPLTTRTELKNLAEFGKHMQAIADKIPTYLWTLINDQLTAYTNSVLDTELGLDLKIGSFAEDIVDLPAYLKKTRGEKVLQVLSRHLNEFMGVVCCVLAPDMSENSFSEISANLLANYNEEVAERTVFVRRPTVLTKLNFTSRELNVYSETDKFTITEQSSGKLFALLKQVIERTGKNEDGIKLGFFKRVLLLEDGSRFTIHEGWMGDGSVIFLKKY